MYNPEAALWPEGYFTIRPDEQITSVNFEDEGESIMAVEPDTSFEQVEAIEFFDESESFNEPFDEPDWLVEDAVFESTGELDRLTAEINVETIGMSDSEVEAYMQDRMGEFWPALLAALPAIIQLAPQVVNAVGSLVSKPSQPKAAPKKTIPAPKPAPPPPPPGKQQLQGIPAPRPAPAPAPSTSADPQQMLNALNNLVSSPVVQQLLSNLASGGGQTTLSTQGNQLSAGNVLNVIAGLAGSLAGAGGTTGESFFPEYIINEEGRYLIDPFDVYQEAELILDLLNAKP